MYADEEEPTYCIGFFSVHQIGMGLQTPPAKLRRPRSSGSLGSSTTQSSAGRVVTGSGTRLIRKLCFNAEASHGQVPEGELLQESQEAAASVVATGLAQEDRYQQHPDAVTGSDSAALASIATDEVKRQELDDGVAAVADVRQERQDSDVQELTFQPPVPDEEVKEEDHSGDEHE